MSTRLPGRSSTIAPRARSRRRPKGRSKTSMNRRDFLVGSMMASGLPALAQARVADKPAAGPMPDVQVLVFDTFGTVVDWRSAVIAEGEQLGRTKGLTGGLPAVADAWRGRFRPAVEFGGDLGVPRDQPRR